MWFFKIDAARKATQTKMKNREFSKSTPPAGQHSKNGKSWFVSKTKKQILNDFHFFNRDRLYVQWILQQKRSPHVSGRSHAGTRPSFESTTKLGHSLSLKFYVQNLIARVHKALRPEPPAWWTPTFPWRIHSNTLVVPWIFGMSSAFVTMLFKSLLN